MCLRETARCCFVEKSEYLSRIPAGPVDQIVINALASYLRKPGQADENTCKAEWQSKRNVQAELADSLPRITTSQLRSILIDHVVKVDVCNDRIDVTIGIDPVTITTSAQLVRRGNELRVSLPPDDNSIKAKGIDPALVRLIIQGFAAKEYLLSGTEIPTISEYDKRHLHRLARISWLAPDIITAMLDGRQPVHLTARHLLRCADIPLEWQQQRQFLGFA